MYHALYYTLLSSIFFYVGPNTDVFSLNLLTRKERRIIYIEPLVAFRNTNRKIPPYLSGEKRTAFVDTLFECEIKGHNETCVDPLTIQHVHRYRETIQKYLVRTSKCDFPKNGLKDLSFHSVDYSLQHITLIFTSDGVRRNLTIYLKRIQDMDTNIMRNGRITTFSRMGTGPNGALGKKFACNYLSKEIRLITTPNSCQINSTKHLPRACGHYQIYYSKKKNPQCEIGDGEVGNNQESYSLWTRTHNWCELYKPR